MKYKFKNNDIVFIYKPTGYYITDRFIQMVGEIVSKRQCDYIMCNKIKNNNVYAIKFSDGEFEFNEEYIIKVGERK